MDIYSATGSTEAATGRSFLIKAEVLDRDGGAPTNRSVTWSVAPHATKESKGTATISTSGGLIGRTQGWVTVTATAKDGSGIRDTLDVEIKPVATKVEIHKDGARITALTVSLKDKSVTLASAVTPAEASQKVTWRSSSATIATVDAAGTVTFLRTGSVTIYCTAADGSGRNTYIRLTIKA